MTKNRRTKTHPKTVVKPLHRARESISNRLARIILLIRLFLRCCGFDFFIPSYCIGSRTVLCFTLCALCLPILVYTMCSRDREMMLRAGTMLGIMGQASVKAFQSYRNRQDFVNAIYYLRILYGRNDLTTNGNADILGRWGRFFWLMERWATVIVTLVIPVFLVVPLYSTGTLLDPNAMVMPMVLPLVDENTEVGMIVLTCMHISFLVLGILGILGGDLVFWLLILHICPMAEMLINVLRKLDVAVQRLDSGTASQQRIGDRWLAMEKSLDNMVKLHQELMGYMTKLSKMYEFSNLVEIFSNAMSICLIMYANFFIFYFPLYIFWLVVFLKLSAICVLGTIVEIYFDKIWSAIVQCNWYRMSVPMQKKFLLFMLQAKRPTYLLAGTSVVNMNLYVSVMKTIYSVAMLLNKMEL